MPDWSALCTELNRSLLYRARAALAEPQGEGPMPQSTLLPCPFCGSRANLEDHRLLWFVRCSSCSACVFGDRAPEPEEELPDSYWQPFRQSAINAWNRRPALITITTITTETTNEH